LIETKSLCIVKLALHLSTACEGFDVTEIFLAYDSSDRSRARPVRDALTAQGFAVHWDQEAPAGVEWETWVRRRLAQCKCVVVLRSAASVQSNRMSHVAAAAEEHGKLIAVRLEPRGAWQPQGQLQGQATAGTAAEGLDLANWRGDLDHHGWQELCRRIETMLRSSLWVQRLIHDAEAERARWRAQYEASAARCKALNDELAVERSERGTAQDRTAGLQAQLDADARARLKLQTAITELEQRLTGTSGKHAEALQLLGEELRQKGAQLAEAQAALTRHQDETARLRTELASAENARSELSSRVTGQEAVIKLRDAHIVELDAKIAERETEVAGVRATVAERDKEAASLRATITERDAEVAGLRASVTERDGAVARLHATVTQRDADIASLRAVVAERNTDAGSLRAAIAQRDADIAGLHADIASVQANITERDSYMADLEASVTQRDTYIAKLTANLAERRAYMADLEASIAQRDTHIADLKTNIAERDTQITSLKTNLKELERRSHGRPAAGAPLPVLSRVTLPVVGLAGAALSILKMRQG
jgi:chromosome segregation ATPase